MTVAGPLEHLPPEPARSGPGGPGEPGSSGGTAVYEGLTFGLVPGHRPLLLDLHVPAASERGGRAAPVVVWIHGGGFRSGDRRYLPPTLRPGSLFPALTAAGIAVATIDYRLSRESVFPAQLDDVQAALAYLAKYSAELGLDTGRLGLWGESAGGTLAALAGLDPATPARVSAVAAWYTPTDLRWADPAFEDHPFTWLLGGPPETLPELAAQASPVVRVRPDAPAFLLVHGDSDRAVPYAHSEELHRLLVDEGNSSTLRLVTGAGHCFEEYDDVDGLIAEGVAFFAEQLVP